MYNTVNMGNNMTCSVDCSYRTAVTLYTLETCRYIAVNTLYNDNDNDDANNNNS